MPRYRRYVGLSRRSLLLTPALMAPALLWPWPAASRLLWAGAHYSEHQRARAIQRGFMFVHQVATDQRCFSDNGDDLLWFYFTISANAADRDLRAQACDWDASGRAIGEKQIHTCRRPALPPILLSPWCRAITRRTDWACPTAKSKRSCGVPSRRSRRWIFSCSIRSPNRYRTTSRKRALPAGTRMRAACACAAPADRRW